MYMPVLLLGAVGAAGREDDPLAAGGIVARAAHVAAVQQCASRLRRHLLGEQAADGVVGRRPDPSVLAGRRPAGCGSRLLPLLQHDPEFGRRGGEEGRGVIKGDLAAVFR